MSDLDKLDQVNDPTAKPLSDDELKKRVGGRLVAKGDLVHLSELDYTLKKLHIGVGWDIPGVDTAGIDVDCSLFLLDKKDQTREDGDFVFYNNLTTCEGGVTHTGDNRTGIGDGDDEAIIIDLQTLPFDVMKMVFVISIYDAEMRDQSMMMLRNAFIRIVNAESDRELLRFPITEDCQQKDSYAMAIAELTREGPVWMFNARGECLTGGLAKIATAYGMMVTG